MATDIFIKALEMDRIMNYRCAPAAASNNKCKCTIDQELAE